MTQTPIKGIKPGDIVTRGAGTARWVVNFIHPHYPDQLTLVKENQKAKSGSTRWWNEMDVYPVKTQVSA